MKVYLTDTPSHGLPTVAKYGFPKTFYIFTSLYFYILTNRILPGVKPHVKTA